jgi:CheY-like chemotaxis protein
MFVQRNVDQALDAQPQPNDGCNGPEQQPIALVVDDEPLVRQLICSVLARLGWRTLEAAQGGDALLVAVDLEIDLLITDYEIPGVKGIELADALRRVVPDLPVVVVSGHGSVGLLASGRGYRFLAKPFDPGELASLVTSVALGQSVG